jgi:hypothetical protein
MDVWEHAYLLDYKPSERQKYIEAFYSTLTGMLFTDVCGRTKRLYPEARDSFLQINSAY